MKYKLTLAVVAVVAVGLVTRSAYHPRMEPPDMPPFRLVGSEVPQRPPVNAADVEALQQRLRETSDRLEKQLLPLIQQMPNEVKRFKALAAQNEQLMKQLAEMAPKPKR